MDFVHGENPATCVLGYISELFRPCSIGIITRRFVRKPEWPTSYVRELPYLVVRRAGAPALGDPSCLEVIAPERGGVYGYTAPRSGACVGQVYVGQVYVGQVVPRKLVPRKLAQRTSSRKFLSKPNVEKVQKKLFRSKIPSNLLQHVFKHFSTCRGRQELENKPKLEITASNGAKYQPGRICTRTMKRNNVRGKNAQRSRQMSKQQQDTRKKSTDIDRSRKNSLGTCIVLWG